MSGAEKKNNGIGAQFIAVAVPAAVDVAVKIANKAMDKQDKKENDITVPDLYRKGFELELDQAIRILDDFGLKAAPSKIGPKEANEKYKDCMDMQVVDSNPKQGSSVNPGTLVYVKYITQDVIDESQKIFDENNRKKQAVKEEKALKKQKRKEYLKESVSETIDSAKRGLEKIFKKDRKAIEAGKGETIDE